MITSKYNLNKILLMLILIGTVSSVMSDLVIQKIDSSNSSVRCLQTANMKKNH
jgi:hypothetical protein